jgi:hypothetical protein
MATADSQNLSLALSEANFEPLVNSADEESDGISLSHAKTRSQVSPKVREEMIKRPSVPPSCHVFFNFSFHRLSMLVEKKKNPVNNLPQKREKGSE